MAKMAQSRMRIILKIFLIFVTLSVSIGATIYLVPKGFLRGEYSKRLIRRKESELIQEALKNLVEIDCKELRSEPQYCDELRFTISSIEPHPKALYAIGSAKTHDNKEFSWAAAKTEGSWRTPYFEDPDKPLPNCLETENFPAEIFNQKFRYCESGGQKIDRLDQHATDDRDSNLYNNEIEFGNYKIELPDGWIEQPKSSSETPEGLCYPPLACLLRERETGSACLYACVQQGNNNYSLITLTDTFESQIPGGWAPSVEEMVMIENKDKEWPFLFVWEGEYIDEENMDPEKGFKKRFDENQNPYIWYIAGCLEKDLCFNYDFNAGSGDSQTYVNYFKEFINGLNIIKN